MAIKNDIEQEIEELRQKMILSGLLNGLTHPNTIEISQKLDMLLNIYQISSPELASN